MNYNREFILAENRLSFWIMVSSIFGMVTSHVKCVKSVGTVPLQVLILDEFYFRWSKCSTTDIGITNNLFRVIKVKAQN